MALHKEFATAGKSPGLQVWRVEKMDLKPVPREFYGEFYTGDSYILLYTTSTPSYNVHTWIGMGFTFLDGTSNQSLAYDRMKFPPFVFPSLFFFNPPSVIPQVRNLLWMRKRLRPSS